LNIHKEPSTTNDTVHKNVNIGPYNRVVDLTFFALTVKQTMLCVQFVHHLAVN